MIENSSFRLWGVISRLEHTVPAGDCISAVTGCLIGINGLSSVVICEIRPLSDEVAEVIFVVSVNDLSICNTLQNVSEIFNVSISNFCTTRNGK